MLFISFIPAPGWNGKFLQLLLCCCTSLLLCVTAFAQTPTTEEWTEAQLVAANTAQDVPYLSAEEKRVILLTNLARLDGARFARTYLRAYVQGKNVKPSLKTSPYVASLVRDLNQVKGLPMLQPEEKLCQSAAYHARDMGNKGLLGHQSSDGTDVFARLERFLQPTGSYGLAENCAYGFSRATDIVLQLLIDEGVGNLGHRKNMLSPKFNLTGVSIQPHKTYRYNCVQDFAQYERPGNP